LRCLEIRGKNSWYFHMSILPSTSRLQRFQWKMNKIGEIIVPFESVIIEDSARGSNLIPRRQLS
jgi:hypothetical protein